MNFKKYWNYGGKMKKKVISLFSGAGGMDLGIIKAGFEVIWANDFEKDAVETYRRDSAKKRGS